MDVEIAQKAETAMDDEDQQWCDALAAAVFFIVTCVVCSAGVFFLILGIVQLSSG